ncbi:DNA-binding MarR family transcriptional regulator [Crossiella equi]|uniref:DNA-binding MarR family transcriptional regulator n=1 Tax=Crossiella equi TaxID=130796 RepID=A0ABS5A7U7_9PSEU|nr:MarR family transcriptional regulator [Crossiella equi]MBP2472386.1 DNA-binding MarR family transcriptional regulator [Crossiella equi]
MGGRRQALRYEDTLGYRVHRAEQAICARKVEVLRQLELTVAQEQVLAFLLGGVEKSATQLGREANVTSQTMTGVLSGLETRGLVTRRPSPDHGRVRLYSLTDPGRAVAQQANELVMAYECELLGRLAPEEREILAKALERIAEK